MVRATTLRLVRAALLLACWVVHLPSGSMASDDTFRTFARQEIAARLSPLRAEIGRTESAELVFQVRNNLRHPLQLLRWGTPLDLGKSSSLRVTLDRQVVPYLGAIAMRGTPTSADHVTLAPGAVLAVPIDLDRYYDFSEPGAYVIECDITMWGITRADGARDVRVAIPFRARTILVVGEPRAKREPTREQARMIARKSLSPTQRSARQECDSAQSATLDTATLRATSLAENMALLIRANANHAAPRYVDWFGAWDNYRSVSAWSTFDSVKRIITRADLTLHCGGDECSGDGVAYVYEQWSFLIWNSGPIRDVYFCPQFWTQNAEAQAGVILHEATHIAGTKDYLYCWDKAACTYFAANHPDQSVENADTFRGCAQDTGTGWGVQPFACRSVENCTNGQFCIHSSVWGGSRCVSGPIRCEKNQDCGPGAMCVKTTRRVLAMYPPPPPPAPDDGKYCVLY